MNDTKYRSISASGFINMGFRKRLVIVKLACYSSSVLTRGELQNDYCSEVCLLCCPIEYQRFSHVNNKFNFLGTTSLLLRNKPRCIGCPRHSSARSTLGVDFLVFHGTLNLLTNIFVRVPAAKNCLFRVHKFKSGDIKAHVVIVFQRSWFFMTLTLGGEPNLDWQTHLVTSFFCFTLKILFSPPCGVGVE